MDTPHSDLDRRRVSVSRSVDRAHRAAFGQFFTPSAVASFMASMLQLPKADTLSLLEPGAGIGSLVAAVLDRFPKQRFSVTCYEIEAQFRGALEESLAKFDNARAQVVATDFIADAVRLVAVGNSPNFDLAILNPPYKKIAVGSPHRGLVRKLGVETSNLYTCFLACAVALCRPMAQVIAIVPRSFMNGAYFRPFRYWLLEHAAISHIHVFESRDRAFADDDVLQENIIVRLIVGGPQERVLVSASQDHSFSDFKSRLCDFDEVVSLTDAERFIHVPRIESKRSAPDGCSLVSLGLDVCTGPVVDFRLKEHLRAAPEAGAVPLMYPTHFASGYLEWPKESRKPNAIMRNANTERWLMPSGCYVVMRRFTAKEEKRRVVAHVFDSKHLNAEAIGFENHLNVFHSGRQGMPADLARGLAAYLNSQAVDDYFRTFSGHTQVNATDLRRLKYPSIDELCRLSQ